MGTLQDLVGNVALVIFKVGWYGIISLTVLHLIYFRGFSEAQTLYKILFHIYATRKRTVLRTHKSVHCF